MTKYAANAMLATRISFMNEIANLCDRVGADVRWCARASAPDARIGNKFTYPGCGYGGSCFPKDEALARTGRENGCTMMQIIEAVERVNERQKAWSSRNCRPHWATCGKLVTIWGLAFKTRDRRHARSPGDGGDRPPAGGRRRGLRLRSGGYARIAAADGRASDPLRPTMYEAAEGADAVALITEMEGVPHARLAPAARGDARRCDHRTAATSSTSRRSYRRVPLFRNRK